MAFNFGIGDAVLVLKLCKYVYDAFKDGPNEYNEIQSELKSMSYAMQSLRDDADDPNSLLNRKGRARKKDLFGILDNCARTLQELETLVEKHSRLSSSGKGNIVRLWDAYQVGSADLDSLRGRLTFHISTINTFLISLEGSTLSRMERKLDRIYTKLSRGSNEGDRRISSLASNTSSHVSISVLSQIESQEDDVWEIIRKELMAEDVSQAHVMAHRDDIIRYVKLLLRRDGSIAATKSFREDGAISLWSSFSDDREDLLIGERSEMYAPMRSDTSSQSSVNPFVDPQNTYGQMSPSAVADNMQTHTRRSSDETTFSHQDRNWHDAVSPSSPSSRQSDRNDSSKSDMVGSWSHGKSRTEALVANITHGHHFCHPACFLFLDVTFWKTGPSSLDKDTAPILRKMLVSCTINGSRKAASPELPKIIAISPHYSANSGFEHDIARASRRLAGALKLSRQPASLSPALTVTGEMDEDGEQASWIIQRNPESWKKRPLTIRFGMLLYHSGQSFDLMIDMAVFPTDSRDLVKLPHASTQHLGLVRISPVRSYRGLYDIGLWSFVDRGNHAMVSVRKILSNRDLADRVRNLTTNAQRQENQIALTV